jgi:preprotein translocase subunit SecB
MADKEKKNNMIDYGLVAKVSDKVNILNVALIQSSFFRKPETNRVKLSLEIKSNVKYEVDKKNSVIMVFPEFKLDGFPEKAEKGEPLLHIEAVFVLVYRVSSLTGLKEENFEAFANANGIYNSWPYWREFVQNTVVRMSLPPLTIPAFHIFQTKKQTKKLVKKKS